MIKLTSINSKIFLSFLILVLLLLSILFIQIIPDMQEKDKEHIRTHIENVIYLTTQQIILAEKAIKNNGIRKRDELKSIMELEANRILKNMQKSTTVDSIYKLSKKEYSFNSKKLICNTTILDKNKNRLLQVENENFKDIKDKLNINEFLRYDVKDEYICSSGLRKFFYTKEIQNSDNYLVLSCDIDKFPSSGEGLEKNIKTNVQTSFSILDVFHKNKTYVMWLNKKNNDNNRAIVNKNDNPDKNIKYCISHLSNFSTPITGLLSGREIFKAVNKKPIRHFINKKDDLDNYIYPALTWIRLISEDENDKFLYFTTIYEKDYIKNSDSPFIKILPSVLISLLVAVFLGFFLFKRVFKSINILKNTVNKVKKGEKNIRSNIKGSDDIALLARDFDNMLDSLEFNIENLDKQVEDKTKLLSNSLEEKETLLKEIHHRVKNNLTITIELIKLEKEKIKSKEAKESLTNIQERIFVMELLHRKLYESKDLNLIPLDKYIQEICDDLHSSYSYDNKIKILSKIAKLNIHIDYALPLGLIITELITNAFKYAFKKEGEISVFFKEEKNTCQLIVKDNGKGLDESFESLKNKSLGFQIITNIIKGQLSGDFTYEYKEGSEFVINFKIKSKKFKK